MSFVYNRNPLNRVRRNRGGAQPPPQSPSPWASVASATTLVSVIAGGFWVAFQFTYSKFIEPTLKPAIIQVSVSSHYVSSSECCNFFELETRLENKGSREVIVHGSHQVVGAKRLQIHQELDPESIKQLNLRFNESRAPGSPETYMMSDVTDYVSTPSQEDHHLIVSAGNITSPKTSLSAGEIYASKTIAIVPKGHVLLSVRGSLYASHNTAKDIDWRWAVDDRTLKASPIAWDVSRNAELDSLRACVKSAKSRDEFEGCKAQMQKTSLDSIVAWKKSDRHSYAQDYTAHFVALPPSNGNR
jgi:hypothetical protein